MHHFRGKAVADLRKSTLWGESGQLFQAYWFQTHAHTHIFISRIIISWWYCCQLFKIYFCPTFRRPMGCLLQGLFSIIQINSEQLENKFQILNGRLLCIYLGSAPSIYCLRLYCLPVSWFQALLLLDVSNNFSLLRVSVYLWNQFDDLCNDDGMQNPSFFLLDLNNFF